MTSRAGLPEGLDSFPSSGPSGEPDEIHFIAMTSNPLS
jgi:hypothetical protein